MNLAWDSNASQIPETEAVIDSVERLITTIGKSDRRSGNISTALIRLYEAKFWMEKDLAAIKFDLAYEQEHPTPS